MQVCIMLTFIIPNESTKKEHVFKETFKVN